MAQTTTTISARPKAGIKIARAGFDVRKATDYQLLFNSAWPSIAIAFPSTINPGSAAATVKHGLGFPPFTMAWVVQGGTFIGRYFPDIDTQNVYLNDPNFVAGNIYYIQCYNLDISKQAFYPFLPPPAASPGPYDKNYGAKFAKSGKSSASSNLNDFIFHTRTQSPAILAVNTTPDIAQEAGTTGETISYTNPNGYTPWVFGYAIFSGVYTFANPYNQAVPSLFINLTGPNTFTIVTGGGGGSLVVLRDPLFVANSIQVQY